jgi:hypothetical protein
MLGRDLVADRMDAEQGRCAAHCRAGRCATRASISAGAARNVEESDVLLPGQSHHDVQTLVVALRASSERGGTV